MKPDSGKRSFDSALHAVLLVLGICVLLFSVSAACAVSDEDVISATFHYSGASKEQQTITIEYSDEWLLRPDNEYNHKLMQASFGLAAAGFRDKEHDLSRKDYNILDLFSQLGFEKPQTEDFNKITTINTIGTAIAHKKVGDAVIVAVSVSGNNYQNEWQSNLTVDDDNRPKGFNSAAEKVLDRLYRYIEDNNLSGNLRLWISGYSRAAAVSNITAADATDSGLFDAVYGYTIATPRTTRDADADRYANIFNIINPFDPVPLVPFPEWGFVRYGTDLFLPSQETDSYYAEKKVKTDAYCMAAKGHNLRYNPQVNSQLHTIMDFSLYFINSSNSYTGTFQSGVVDFWKNHDPSMLIADISIKIATLPKITGYQLSEFYAMADYIMQAGYTDLAIQKFHRKSEFWDKTLSLQENIMHEHYDEVYRSWLLSSDDPGEIFMNDPRYVHYSILGDVDAEVYDSKGRFVSRIARDGTVSEGIQNARFAMIEGLEDSPHSLFAIRQDQQTLIVLPMDEEYYVIFSPKEKTEIRTAYVEYNAKELRADVKYVLNETIEKDEIYYGNIDPDMIYEMNDDELLAAGFRKTEPWSQEIVYSPAAVMRLENTGIFHPSPLIFLTFSGLALLFMLYLLLLGLIGTGHGVKKAVRAVKDRRKASIAESKGADTTDGNGSRQPQARTAGAADGSVPESEPEEIIRHQRKDE